MGQIYYQASLTIFAAAGPDPSYGLPGVSRARLLPDTVVHHPYAITPIPDKPQRYIQQSIWATRGWTYQEAYLSRRRLFFTDVQLYFECATAPREEFLFYQGLNSAPSDDCLFPRPDLNLLDKKTLFGCIVDYSRREFGFIGDRLRGFLGILAVFATRSRYRTYHIWGVPVKLTSYGIQGTYKPLLGLFGSTPSDRSPDFPSWSWVGWSGQALKMDFQSEDYRSLVYSVELDKGNRTEALTSTLLRRYYSFGSPPEAVPAVLRLSGMSFPIYAVKHFSPSPGCRLVLTDKESYGVFPTDQGYLKELVEDSDWVCWQDPDGVWIYANYHLIDTRFMDGQEGNRTELLGVPLVMESRLGKRLVAILRAVEGGHETVGYLPILSARFKTKFFQAGEDTKCEGNLIETQEAYCLGWMKLATIRWL
ncbi:HET-domain-containing protein [Apiospora arundinis]|uniref:HET-domain-containing protein n=1 Tax=Apiospora arundinis TaxID=335852 RepID=A0ABR2HM67_9PEZI